MDFVGAVVDARGALVAIPEGQRRLVGHAHRAMHLNGPVEHVLEHFGHVELDQRDAVAGGVGAVAVDLLRRLQDQQPRRVEAISIDPNIRDLAPILLRVMQKNPDGFLLQLHAPSTALLIQQARQLNIELPIIAGSIQLFSEIGT